MYLWFTDEEYETLINNGKETSKNGQGDHVPVVKLFTPDADATWLLTDIVPPEDDEESDLAFGLCDLGLGTPELGYVSLSELFQLRGNWGLPVEKDVHFLGKAPIQVYAQAAHAHGHIVEDVV